MRPKGSWLSNRLKLIELDLNRRLRLSVLNLSKKLLLRLRESGWSKKQQKLRDSDSNRKLPLKLN